MRIWAAGPVALLALLLTVDGNGQSGGRTAVSVQLLAINDFHGNLQPASGSNGRIGQTLAGGVEYLATHLKRAAAANANTLIVSAGDLVGASPLASALFHDEPTIRAMNALGLAVSSVGNHEFDHGWRELMRLQKGGCHPVDGCRGDDSFPGAQFEYLAANVATGPADAATLLPATTVRTIGGVRIGFIGETLRDTPTIVAPSGVAGLRFLDEAATANRYAARLTQDGVRAIVLLVHEGGAQHREPGSPPGPLDPNGCAGFTGSIVPIVKKLSADIKVVISGHTHQFYNCTIAGHTVTSASAYGRMLTRVTLTIDPASGTIGHVAAQNEIVDRDVPPDPAQTAIVSKYAALAAPLGTRVVGTVARDILREANVTGESALGDVIADAELAATAAADKGAAVVAFMNQGGIRADITADALAGREKPGEVTYSELFAVQPFGNNLRVVTLTGDAIRRLLEQQFNGQSPGTGRVLQVSAGFSYKFTLNAPPGRRVDARSITLNGRPVGASDRLRVALTDFVLDGGDGFTVLKEATDRIGGDVDVDALVAYFRGRSPVGPGPQDRIVRVDR